MERRNEVSRPVVRAARALAVHEEETYRRPSWLIAAVAVVALAALGFLRLAPAWGAEGDGGGGSNDPAVMRYDAEDADGDDDGAWVGDDDTTGDATGATGTTGPSDPGSLTDGNHHTGPTGNTGTFTDGAQHTGPTNDTGPDDGTLTDGNHNTGPTGNTNTATDGRG
jgi:hypothetical protein